MSPFILLFLPITMSGSNSFNTARVYIGALEQTCKVLKAHYNPYVPTFIKIHDDNTLLQLDIIWYLVLSLWILEFNCLPKVKSRYSTKEMFIIICLFINLLLDEVSIRWLRHTLLFFATATYKRSLFGWPRTRRNATFSHWTKEQISWVLYKKLHERKRCFKCNIVICANRGCGVNKIHFICSFFSCKKVPITHTLHK